MTFKVSLVILSEIPENFFEIHIISKTKVKIKSNIRCNIPSKESLILPQKYAKNDEKKVSQARY